MSEPLWRKKLFSGRWLATVTACVAFLYGAYTGAISGQDVEKIVLVVFTFYFTVDRNGHGNGKET